jgi:hypothetical protein
MTSDDINTLLKLFIPFFVFIFCLFVFYFYKNRARKTYDLKHVQSIKSISIDLTMRLRDEYAHKTKWIKILPPLTLFFVYLFVMGMIVLGEGPGGFQMLFNKDTTLFKINLFVLFALFIGGVLAHFRLKHTMDHLLNAYKISRHSKLIFNIENDELIIPSLMLCNPAFWRASELNQTHIKIKLSEIESLEIYQAAGNSPSQYKIITKGASEIYGKGKIGESDFINFGICIKRDYLKLHESQIIKLFHERLGDKLIMRDDLPNNTKINPT